MLEFADRCTAPKRMYRHASSDCDKEKKAAVDLCELYCGNGNFTVALARNFKAVLGTEVSRASVALAQHNLAENGLTNTCVARMSAEEFGQGMRGERHFSRLDAEGISLSSFEFGTLLVDPPR